MKKKALQGSNALSGSKSPARRLVVNSRRQKGAGTVEYMLLTGLMVAALLTPFGEEGESVQQRLMNAIRDQQEAFHYAARLPHMPTLDAEGNIVGSDEPLNGGPFDQRLPGGETGTSSNVGGAGNGASNGGPYGGDGPYGGGESSSNGIWGSDGIEGQGQSSVEGGFSGPSIEDILQQADQSALDDKAQFMQCRQERVVAAQQEANRMPANSAQQTELQATAERLRANTVAQEHYGLFEHLHSPGQPAPAGWQEVGNSQASLNQAKLSPSRLTSKQSDFRAGMYTPDPDVLGGDFSPTLKATGSRASNKNWHNTVQHATRSQPDDHERIVQLGTKVHMARPSQATGGAGITPLTRGLSASAIEGDDANGKAGYSVLGADLSDLVGAESSDDSPCSDIAPDDIDDPQGSPQQCQGSWEPIDSVIGYGKSVSAEGVTGSLVRLRAADARAALHVNSFHYEVTFTYIDENGDPIYGVYPVHSGVLTTFPGGFGSSKIFNNTSPSDWTVSILNQQKACDNCGEPQIRVQQCIE
ncbi:hypothetical protein ACU6TU_13525 [Halomonas sp. LS-001]